MYYLLKTVLTYRILCVFLFISITVSLVSAKTLSPQNAAPQSSISQELIIMTGELEPYAGSTRPGLGFTPEIIMEASRAVGLKVSIQFAPWPRCEAAIKYGKAFAGFPYSTNDSRVDFAFFSQPIAKSRTVFFYNTNKLEDFNFSRLEEVKLHLIGGVRGYYYEPQFKKMKLSVDYSDSEDDALKKLFVGRVTFLPLNELVGWDRIKKLFPKQSGSFNTSETALDEKDLNLMVSRKYPDSTALLQRFNEGLTTIVNNGFYKKIMEKHRDTPSNWNHRRLVLYEES